MFVPHEYLGHNVSSTNVGELNLQTLTNHLKNPYNTVNTSLTPTLILHELHYIQQKILLMDASSCKDLEPFKDLAIIKGAKIEIKPNITKQEASYIYSKATIEQTLENNFSLATVKPSFIGEFSVEEIDLKN